MGIASLIFGVLALLTFGIPLSFGGSGMFFGLIALILGLLGRRRLLEEGRSAGTAVGGMVLGLIGLLGGVANMALCLTLCASSPATTEETNAGQAWAEQMAQELAQAQPTPSTPTTPATPAVPGTQPNQPMPMAPPVPGTPGVPAMPMGGQVLMVNTPVTAVFAPGLPVDGENRAYLDYTFNVAAPGTYTINLISPNPTAYDPYLRLLQNGAEIVSDDDGGGYPNSRITRQLAPGAYTVRVTSFRTGQIAAPAPFNLSVTGG